METVELSLSLAEYHHKINKEAYNEEEEIRRAYWRACNKRRVLAIKQRTPSWADSKEIEAIYISARCLTELTGIQFHVDHIIPLQGGLVSGLHTADNLQILTAHDNTKKGSSYGENI